VFNFRSQFFQSRRHFSSHANDRSTTHLFGIMKKKTKQNEQNLLKGILESQNHDKFHGKSNANSNFHVNSTNFDSKNLTADEISQLIQPYQSHLKNFDLTDIQKLEFVESIRLMVNILFDQFFEINELFFIEKRQQNKVDCNVQNANLKITKANKNEGSKR
jgi:hypothetical protein